jgi:hypothetical protein
VSDDPIRIHAHHEAGHALAALKLDLQLRRLTLDCAYITYRARPKAIADQASWV